MTYYVLFFIHLDSRRVGLAGITRHPDEAWMQQMAQCDERKLGATGTPAVRPARSGHEVLRLVSVDAGGGRHQADPVAAAQSEPERSRGTMGAVREAGKPVDYSSCSGRLRCDAFWLSSSHIFTRSGITKEKGTSCCSRANR